MTETAQPEADVTLRCPRCKHWKAADEYWGEARSYDICAECCAQIEIELHQRGEKEADVAGINRTSAGDAPNHTSPFNID